MPQAHRVEEQPLPPDPAQEKLPDGVPVGDWVEPLEAGSCAQAPATCPPRSGIVVSEARAARDALYRIRYPELRRTFEADRQVMKAHRELYEERLRHADLAIQKLQPGWWQRHGSSIAFIGGFLLSTVASVAVFAAVR